MLLKSIPIFLIVTLAVGEVIDFQQGDNNFCSFSEVRVTPCTQANEHKPCIIHRRKLSKMSFEFTPNFDADSIEVDLFWVKGPNEELPLISMDKDACKYTSCPLKSGQKQEYNIDIPISSKFPTSSYTIKWVMSTPSGQKCYFTHNIKLVR